MWRNKNTSMIQRVDSPIVEEMVAPFPGPLRLFPSRGQWPGVILIGALVLLGSIFASLRGETIGSILPVVLRGAEAWDIALFKASNGASGFGRCHWTRTDTTRVKPATNKRR
jgi:hypothetical protein